MNLPKSNSPKRDELISQGARNWEAFIRRFRVNVNQRDYNHVRG